MKTASELDNLFYKKLSWILHKQEYYPYLHIYIYIFDQMRVENASIDPSSYTPLRDRKFVSAILGLCSHLSREEITN